MKDLDKNNPQSIKEIQTKLISIGYHVYKSGVFDMQTVEALKAFQRHWRPVKVNGMLDVSTKQILTEVYKKLSEYREVVISLCGQLVIFHVKTNMLDGWMIAIY